MLLIRWPVSAFSTLQVSHRFWLWLCDAFGPSLEDTEAHACITECVSVLAAECRQIFYDNHFTYKFAIPLSDLLLLGFLIYLSIHAQGRLQGTNSGFSMGMVSEWSARPSRAWRESALMVNCQFQLYS